MKRSIYCLASFTILYGSAIYGQSEQQSSSSRISLPVQANERADIVRRNELHYEIEAYFAKPGRSEIRDFDVGLMDKIGAEVDFIGFGGSRMKLRSLGIERTVENGHHVGFWRGEVLSANGHKYPESEVMLAITTWAINDEGEYVVPARNHRQLKRLLDAGANVVPAEAYERRDEEIVEQVAGRIVIPGDSSVIQITPLDRDRGRSLVIEMDDNKRWNTLLGDGGRPISRQEADRANQRSSAYLRHVEEVKARILARKNNNGGN